MRGRTTLTDAQFEAVRAVAVRVLASTGELSNAALRAASFVNYDQAIAFFRRARAEGWLLRIGSGSGTRYVRVVAPQP